MDHEPLATVDLGDGWSVGVCECGWATPNVRGAERAVDGVRLHAALRAYADLLSPSGRPGP